MDSNSRKRPRKKLRLSLKKRPANSPAGSRAASPHGNVDGGGGGGSSSSRSRGERTSTALVQNVAMHCNVTTPLAEHPPTTQASTPALPPSVSAASRANVSSHDSDGIGVAARTPQEPSHERKGKKKKTKTATATKIMRGSTPPKHQTCLCHKQ